MTPEDADLCARLKQPFRSGEPVNALCADAADRIEQLSAVVADWVKLVAEIDVLRRVVRAADEVRMSHAGYNRSVDDAGNDDMRAIRYKYDEARAALTEFDRAAQEKTNAGV